MLLGTSSMPSTLKISQGPPCHRHHHESTLRPAPATHVQTRTVIRLSHPRSAWGRLLTRLTWQGLCVSATFCFGRRCRDFGELNPCTSSNCEHLASCQWGELAAIVEHSSKNAEVKQGHALGSNKSRRAKLYMSHCSFRRCAERSPFAGQPVPISNALTAGTVKFPSTVVDIGRTGHSLVSQDSGYGSAVQIWVAFNFVCLCQLRS